METKDLASLSIHLPDLFGRRQWHVLWRCYTISRKWQELVGSDIAARSNPASIQKDVLWINVCDSVWMQQLHALKPAILRRIRSVCPEVNILDVRFRLRAPAHASSEVTGRRRERKKPDPRQARDFARQIEAIDNDECREALYRLWLAFHQHQE